MKRLTQEKADARAADAIKELGEKYKGIEFRLAVPTPIELPDGWRFPYDSYYDGKRIRSKLIVLFVPRESKKPEELALENLTERDDWRDDGKPLETFEKKLRSKPSPQLISEAAARAKISKEYPTCEIYSLEPVWDLSKRTALGWRASLRAKEGGEPKVVFVPSLAKGTLQEDPPRYKSAGVFTTIAIGPARIPFDVPRPRFVVNWSAASQIEQGQWTVMSCLHLVHTKLHQLGYRDPRQQIFKIDFEYDPGGDVGKTFIQDNLPTIRFADDQGERFCWARDPSIVLHELGHAVWHLNYAPLPDGLDSEKDEALIVGVEEGFCDYFAAWLLSETPLASGKHNFQLGEFGCLKSPLKAKASGIARGVAGGAASPLRVLTGEPAVLENLDNLNEYEIARVWGNFLWELHLKWGLKVAPRIILQAHLHPAKRIGSSAQPLIRYAEALEDEFNKQHTSRTLGVGPSNGPAEVSPVALARGRHLTAFEGAPGRALRARFMFPRKRGA